MAFDVTADAYARFMGRYSEQLAERFLDFALVTHGQRALDVGCGPGALTARLVEQLGPERVAAVEPSASFLAAVRERLPRVEVREAAAEAIPFPDDEFDAALAQLVVHFMADPVAGLREMRRVTRAGGAVAACVWDHAGGRGPLSPFWEAVHALQPGAPDESGRPGSRTGDLHRLFVEAGLGDVTDGELTVSVRYSSFAEWWEPFTLGVGPAGDYVTGLVAERRTALRDALEQRMSPGPFDITATAWCVRGRV